MDDDMLVKEIRELSLQLRLIRGDLNGITETVLHTERKLAELFIALMREKGDADARSENRHA